MVDYVIQNDIPTYADTVGEHLRKGLNALASRHEFITEVRGMGLLQALQFNSDISAQIVSLCNQEGLLLNPLRPNALRLMPPLTVTPEEVDLALERLESALSKITFS